MSEPNNNGGADRGASPTDGPANPHPVGTPIPVWPEAEEGPPRAYTVFKFPLDVRDPKLVMPRGAIVLHIGTQLPGHGQLSVWAEVEVAAGPLGTPIIDDTVVMEQVPVEVFGTGHPMEPKARQHMGSAIDGPFVWHVFRVLPR